VESERLNAFDQASEMVLEACAVRLRLLWSLDRLVVNGGNAAVMTFLCMG
jgi:hypothetical protein